MTDRKTYEALSKEELIDTCMHFQNQIKLQHELLKVYREYGRRESDISLHILKQNRENKNELRNN